MDEVAKALLLAHYSTEEWSESTFTGGSYLPGNQEKNASSIFLFISFKKMSTTEDTSLWVGSHEVIIV